jgi:hypothetical protein
VRLPFQSSLENAPWTAFLPLGSYESSSFQSFGTGSLIQYPSLYSIKQSGSFKNTTEKKEGLDNSWMQKIIDNNPDIRGFLSFVYRYLTVLPASTGEFLSLFPYPCGVAGVQRLAPSPYIRFVDIKNNSFSSLKIESIRSKTIAKDKYKLTPIPSERNQLFQDIYPKDESIGISIPPNSHLFVPIEFGFDTRISKNVRRGYIDGSTGEEVGNLTNQNIENSIYENRKIFLANLNMESIEGNPRDPDSFMPIDSLVKSTLDVVNLPGSFVSQTKKLTELFNEVPNRFSVGSLRDIVSLRIAGKDIRTDNPLSDPRFSMSVYFAYGSCPYLMVYDAQKGYWIELGTVITGRQDKSWQGYEIHSLGDHPLKFRLEEREAEVTFIDQISILYKDSQNGGEAEVSSQISELTDADNKYFVLHQGDSLEIDLKKILPTSAIDVRLKINGYYEVLPGATLMQPLPAS